MKTFILLAALLLPLNAHAYLSGSGSGGGGGAVDSVNGQTGTVTLTTDEVDEGSTNQYYTNARCIAAPLTGYSSAAGTVAGTDTILQAINKLNGNAGLELKKASNLSDLASASTARTNLGLGTAATSSTSDFLQPGNNLSDVSNAGTARTNLGLGTGATATIADYLKLGGVSGGQTAEGGTGSAETLVLSSTHHATKGKVTVGGAVTVDEANVKVGVNNSSPAYKFQVTATADDYAHGFVINNSVGGANALWRFYADIGGPLSIANPNQTTQAFTAAPLGGVGLAAGNPAGGAEVNVKNNAAKTTTVSLGVTAIGSQTAALQEWKDSSNVPVLTVEVDGVVKTAAGNESTGAGSALLGANSPASTLTAPYTWIKMKSSDGSTVYVPAWK